MDQQFSFKLPKKKDDSGPASVFGKGSGASNIFAKSATSNPFKFVRNTSATDSGNNSTSNTTNSTSGAPPPASKGSFGGFKAGFLSKTTPSSSFTNDHPRPESKSFFGSAISGSGIGLKSNAEKKEQFMNKFKISKNLPDRSNSPSGGAEEEKARPSLRSRLTLGNPATKWLSNSPKPGSSRESSPRPKPKTENAITENKPPVKPFSAKFPTTEYKPSLKPFAEKFSRPSISLNTEQKAIIRSLNELQNRYCEDEYSRYLVLDERDKQMYKWRTEMEKIAPPTEKKNRDMVGSCGSMCSEKEKYVRKVQKRISQYECDEDGEVDDSKLVKEYSRSAADQEKPLPHELRRPELIQYTMNYLLTEILDAIPSNAEELVGWYDFLWNRTRAIRKEITQLMLSDELAVSLVESCTRLHIVAAYALCALEQEKFDQKMNTENLGKCLQSLRHLYEDLAKRGIFCSSEAEFRAYDVMLHLHDSNVLGQVLSYRKEVRDSKPVRLAIQLASSMQTNNFARFFRLLRNEATYLQCCICHRFFSQVRSRALAVMVVAAGVRNATVELDKLVSVLAFGSREVAVEMLMEYGIRQNDMNVDEVMLDRGSFTPSASVPMVTYEWIEAKKTCKMSETVNGGPIKVLDLVPEVVDSFENGYYSQDPVLEEFLAKYGQGKLEDAVSHRSRESTPVPEAPVKPAPKPAQSGWGGFDAYQKPVENKEDEEAKRKAASLALIEDTSNALVDNVMDAVTKQIVAKGLAEEKKESEEKEKLMKARQKREEAESILKRQEEALLEEIVADTLKKAIEQEMKVEYRREAERFCEEMTDKVWDSILMPAMDKQLKGLLRSFLKAENRMIDAGLQQHKRNLSLLWLRQFWDQWRNRVAVRRQNRQERELAWDSFRPNWSCGNFVPDRYVQKRKTSLPSTDSPLDNRKRIALADFRRKRLVRIATKTFFHWREFTKKRIALRNSVQKVVNSVRRPRPLRRINSPGGTHLGFLRRRQSPDADSPLRKAPRLSFEESFSFPAVSKQDPSDSFVENDLRPDSSFQDCSMVSEHDLSIARRALERSFVADSVPHPEKQREKLAVPEVDEKAKEETLQLISEVRRGQESTRDLQRMASTLAANVREHQEFLEKMIESTLSKRRAAN